MGRLKEAGINHIATSEGEFGWTGRLQEADINHIFGFDRTGRLQGVGINHIDRTERAFRWILRFCWETRILTHLELSGNSTLGSLSLVYRDRTEYIRMDLAWSCFDAWNSLCEAEDAAGPPCFSVIKTDQFIPGRCSPAVHGCASSTRNNNQSSVVDAIAVVLRSESPKPDA
jgi:hypothetical protein